MPEPCAYAKWHQQARRSHQAWSNVISNTLLSVIIPRYDSTSRPQRSYKDPSRTRRQLVLPLYLFISLSCCSMSWTSSLPILFWSASPLTTDKRIILHPRNICEDEHVGLRDSQYSESSQWRVITTDQEIQSNHLATQAYNGKSRYPQRL